MVSYKPGTQTILHGTLKLNDALDRDTSIALAICAKR